MRGLVWHGFLGLILLQSSVCPHIQSCALDPECDVFEALLDVCFATLRAGGILGLAMAGFGLYGAVSGWVGAVGAILFVASLVIGWPRGGGDRAANGCASDRHVHIEAVEDRAGRCIVAARGGRTTRAA